MTPSAGEGARGPEAADRSYGSASRYLIGAARDTKKFPPSLKENVNYGFLRNRWGLKLFGLILAFLGIFASPVDSGLCTIRTGVYQGPAYEES